MTTETVYDVDYFIAKFEAIPEGDIGRGSLANKCALHHCGVKTSAANTSGYETTAEAEALINLLAPLVSRYLDMGVSRFEVVWHLNDRTIPGYAEKTPKQRFLAVLRNIKATQEAAK